MARAVLGGGCFWCVEGAYKNMRGIESALPGYAGGHDPNPNYKSVCRVLLGMLKLLRLSLMNQCHLLRNRVRCIFHRSRPNSIKSAGK